MKGIPEDTCFEPEKSIKKIKNEITLLYQQYTF
jgi:hypothetical protein